MKGFNVSDEERLCALATVYEVRIALSLSLSLFVLMISTSYPMGLQRFFMFQKVAPLPNISL